VTQFKHDWTRLAWIGGYLTLSFSVAVFPTASQAQPQLNLANDRPIAQRTEEVGESSNAEETINETDILTVGIGGSPPFLIQDGDEYEGIVADLWQQIALGNNLAYELVLQTQTQAALEAVASGELDLLVGPFSITSERLETVNFTRPFFTSNVSVLLPEEVPTLWKRLRPFFTTAALSSVGGVIVCLFIVGNAMWFAERKHNSEQFSEHYVPGIGHGMWFALVTLTTVGYGDRTPATPVGRFIASIWMMISLIAVSSLIGGLASAFTLALSEIPSDQIAEPDDLQGSRMAVVSGTTGEFWATEYQARLLRQPTLEDAIALLSDGKVDGVVFDRPALEYYLAQNPEVELRVAAFTLHAETFGFALPHNSSLTKLLDVTIVRLRENGTLKAISDRWIQGIGTPNESE
jgi:polar amino acid transport system substrate-binding protein